MSWILFQTPQLEKKYKYGVPDPSKVSYHNIIFIQVVIEIKGGGGEQDKPGSPITPLMVEIFNLTNYKLNIRISDPNKQRWQIPER